MRDIRGVLLSDYSVLTDQLTMQHDRSIFRKFTSVIRLLGFLVSLLVVAPMAQAAPGNSGITYQGRILKPDGSSLEGTNVQFRLQIRTPDSGGCLMYEEIQAIDMRNSKGVFALTMNDGTGARTDSSGLTLDRIFGNFGTFTLNVATCTTGTGVYAPNDGDGRALAVAFKDETMTAWELMPAQKINFVPLAFEAKQVQGFKASQLLRVVEADGITPTLTPVSPLSNAEYLKLKDLAAGNTAANSVDSATIVNGSIVGADLAPNLNISTTGTITTSSVSTTTAVIRSLQLLPSSGSAGITFAAPVGASNYTITYPAAQGAAGEVLLNDGAGNMAWNYIGAHYISPGASGTNGLWFRMATATITAQYGFASSIIEFQSRGTYDTNPANGRISFRLKMQDPPGGATAASVQVDSASSALRPDDVRIVITSNVTGGSTVAELWVRLQNNYNAFDYHPIEVNSASGTLNFTPSSSLQASPPVGLQTISSTMGMSPWYRVGPRNENGYGSWHNIAYMEGNVGVGEANPLVKFQVSGTMVSNASSVPTGAAVDLALSNTTVLTAIGGSSIALTNLVNGGNYTIVIKDPAVRTYDFTGCTTKRWLPANGPTTASSWSAYTILALDNGSGGFDCMITWASGYQ
ncbi:MAG: hypothetical protein EOP06_02220 [Proteobacteria bacterium]|nr:MAG: hypothetical protein EOP06_02220 [Pseudomonadota bacterium]